MGKLGIRELILGIVLMGIALTCVNADEWMRTYGPGEGRCVQQTKDRWYITMGQGYTISPASLCLIKTNSLGDTLWGKDYYYLGPAGSADEQCYPGCADQTSGIYSVIWDASDAPTGAYFCILKQEELIGSEKIVVLK